MTEPMTSHPADASRRRLLLASTLAPFATHAAPEAAAATAVAGERLRIAFGSCAKQSKPQPIWQAVAAAAPDLFLFLGDNLYADAEDEATFRQRYDEFRAVQPLQEFRRRFRHLAVWDDHDFGTDDCGGDYPLKKLSQQLFCDAWDVPADSPRRTRDGVYESWIVPVGSRRVQVILLDLRYNRTPLVADPHLKGDYRVMVLKARLTGRPMTGWYVPNEDPAATMLGEPQWQWLEQQLRVPADVRIVGSSVQFAADGTGWEGWANFPRERRRFVDLVKKTRAEGVVFLSGDMHYADLSRWPVDGGYPLLDLTSSGLTEVWDVPTPNARRVSEVLAEPNFGLVDIAFDGPEPHVAMQVRDVKGATRLAHVLPLSQLRFPASPASPAPAPASAAAPSA
jgi:alkaline phosphatase D